MSGFLSAGIVGGSDIPDSVVDTFEERLYEDENKTLSDYYSGDLASATRQTSVVNQGSYALELSGSGGKEEIQSTSGLNAYPSLGGTFEAYHYTSRSGGKGVGRIGFGTQSETLEADGYYVELHKRTGEFTLAKIQGGSFTDLDTVAYSYDDQSWYRVETDWQDPITSTLYDDTDTQVARVSASDTTYTSGGISWFLWDAGVPTNPTVRYDDYELL